MNVDFLQVSFDVIPRINAMCRNSAGLPSPTELVGWLVTLWFDEVARLNERDKGPIYKSQKQLIHSLFCEIGDTVKDAERAFEALVEFGFIERTMTEDVVRLRGMSRYFELAEMREERRESAKRAGMASAKSRAKSTTNIVNDRSNTRSNTRSKKNERTVEPSEVKLSEVKSSKDINTSASPKGESPPASEKPNQLALSDKLVAEFKAATGKPYRFLEADGVQLARLRKTEADEEILRRWRIGLRSEGFYLTESIAQLAAKWNSLATEKGPKGKPRRTDIAQTDPGVWTDEGFQKELLEVERRINATGLQTTNDNGGPSTPSGGSDVLKFANSGDLATNRGGVGHG